VIIGERGWKGTHPCEAGEVATRQKPSLGDKVMNSSLQGKE